MAFRLTLIAFLYLNCIGCRYDPLANMPDFRILLTDGRGILRTNEIGNGQPIMLIHFDSDCRDCQEEAETIIKHIDELQDVKIMFLSVQPFDDILLFRAHFKFEQYPNIDFGRDIDTGMARHFGSAATPMLALYNKDRKLKALVKGNTDFSKLISVVKQIN